MQYTYTCLKCHFDMVQVMADMNVNDGEGAEGNDQVDLLDLLDAAGS